MDARGAAAHRRALVAGLRGRVVEVGAGDGAHFAHYRARVTGVGALEPEPLLRRAAEEAAAAAPVPVRVQPGLADRIPLAGGAADAVVCSLVLCTVPDPAAALREARRVLRPGG